MLTKRIEHAFGKDTMLIGLDQDSDLIWLEEPRWDCEWYWGFGYVETYTRQANPQLSRDITTHQHGEGLLSKQDNGDYKHHINEILKESVLSDDESWKVSDLMMSAYTLRKTAEVLAKGNSNLTSEAHSVTLVDLDIVKKINEVMLPAIFEQIRIIFTPTED